MKGGCLLSVGKMGGGVLRVFEQKNRAESGQDVGAPHGGFLISLT